MIISRRHLLKGLGGAALGLPFLESLTARPALAQEAETTFAVFFRQANGVAQAGQTVIGTEPERFFPRSLGPLTPQGMQGRAVEELVDFRDRLLVVRNVNMENFDYGDGHARGAMQGLTAMGPTVNGQGGNSEAGGESLDHRIGRQLNPDNRDSLFMYAGRNSGWLGGACISYRNPGQRRRAENNPWNAYEAFVSGDQNLTPEARTRLLAQQQSVNDLVRGQMQSLLNNSRLSTSDRQRLQLHFDSVRELEVSLACRFGEDQERQLENQSPGFDSTNGDDTLRTARLHMDVVALAIACGHTRSAAIQVGSGNDGSTRYRNLESGGLMENFHYLSHRRLSHGGDGNPIDNSDILHHYVDVQFAQTFRHLLQRLDAYTLPSGKTLLECGVAAWYNDNANGPPHGRHGVPWILAGGANGYLRQGETVELGGGGDVNHNRLLNTIGAAVGLQNERGEPLDNFGSPSLQRGLLPEIRT
ncbi:MAG: DUF1552 domain-containing protein [Myxococcota bacterium]